MLGDQNIYFTGEYHLDMIPLDSDLILENKVVSDHVFVNNNIQ